ncbi:hypothetical protein HPULCUR_000354 [Helicostylum pulchrum]|uniref:Uncharacterized protein n=1 Tax=Helicostylum pulchrum TaxID=562976 RepID=A0ABP9XKP6_9FUNG
MTQVRLLQKTKALLENKECSSKKRKLQTQQRKYIKTFLVMYFGYLNQLIQDQSVQNTEYENKKSIRHVLLLEKRLLRSIIGTKKELKEILIASDLFQNEVKTKKLKIITHGEGILPALQRELGLNLALKSYYVLSQLHTTYIQVTLYQVVQITETNEEEASAIIIQNETLPIESIYDSLCKYMWSHAELDNNLIQCCGLHQEGFSNLNLDCVDEKVTIKLSKECKCRIDLSIRDILDVALRPVISDIINTISSTLVNGDLFGKYYVEHQFVLGNLFQLSYNSPLHKKMTSMVQEELDDVVEYRELGLCSFALLKSIDQLLRPKIGNRHSLHEVFHNGCLHQVSRENYGLDFYAKKSQRGIAVSYKDGMMENTVDAGNISVILRRGQLIENEAFIRIFAINSKHLCHGENIQIRLLRFSHLLEETSNDDIISLSSISCDVVQKFFLKRNSSGAIAHVVIKMKPKNHFSSLNFTAKMIGEDDSKTTGTFVYVGEQLTVAYF